jgi:uncharacterized protein (TIGR03084 family)
MNLPEAADFLAESEALHKVIEPLDVSGFEAATQFKGWTINDVIVHLYFWNLAADLSATDETEFGRLKTRVQAVLDLKGGLREIENGDIIARGPELREKWIAHAREMAERWRDIDPKRRLPWVGPTMSARSSITARQMETWAHGFEVFDILGLKRSETDRIRNIVVLGINTFNWSHKVHGLPVPELVPRLVLTAPSGMIWEFGDSVADTITGTAVDFAAVVTQTRALSNTSLAAEGSVAETWMANAQCFAGPPETPPEKGSRYRAHRMG